MLRYHGLVESVEDGWAKVSARIEACALIKGSMPHDVSYDSCQCLAQGPYTAIRAKDNLRARIGDVVVVEQRAHFGLDTILVFLVPSLLGAVLCPWLKSPFIYITLCLGIGMGVFLAIRNIKDKDKHPPSIVKILSHQEDLKEKDQKTNEKDNSEGPHG